MEEKVKLSVLGFSFNQTQSGAYGLVLAEEDGIRRLMVVVGTPEAQSIAFKLQGSVPPRPLTHDLFKSLLSQLGVVLREVQIYKYENGVFFSKMILSQGEHIVEIESRTSDAVGIALRTRSPIYTTERIMQEQAIIFDENSVQDNARDDEKDSLALDYSLLNQEELETLLKDAIEGEDYELASLLRDELKRKRNNPI
ncbi:bifunctional DNase/RNase [Dysgonomonas sp. PFB1-18]|uniref:bifunctional nuclease family protein n=1 Tax=unclassified Dysgonomonas TaxID=2630389 RepID=UPI0024736D66|nr:MULTISPECIES: bifunctional nuclease family protein [unclassified Dysgonomonas]MDH6307098.1 bifunctional DNase/RNase [Dysgonomonas sp. PF1-14]MDH6337017.1 bifunctional DNase/RNase [Dysgonomonas sp. PF1-16]MDH6381003.1 bifunctional DNase/RNase [Dysgonomonas sp. PFB1-18]MDH6396418.1 bifunctional DNase/RNase [Dysgonomonas sp. PF1-23]